VPIRYLWNLFQKVLPGHHPLHKKFLHPAQRRHCSETTLTGESRFHISTPVGIEPGVPYDEKQTGGPLDQWTVCKCSEITGSPHHIHIIFSTICYEVQIDVQSFSGNCLSTASLVNSEGGASQHHTY
jgi:hypothetical protein